jgi:hypothetical protein
MNPLLLSEEDLILAGYLNVRMREDGSVHYEPTQKYLDFMGQPFAPRVARWETDMPQILEGILEEEES